MRRSKRQHSPEEEWVEGRYGSQRKEEAQTTKRPRPGSPAQEAELQDTCPRKNHHGKTYQRRQQITTSPHQITTSPHQITTSPHQITTSQHQALQSKARAPRRGAGAWDWTRAMGTLIRTSNGKDLEVSVCRSTLPETNTNTNTGGQARPPTAVHSDAHLHPVHAQHKVSHSSAHAHVQRTHSHTRSRVHRSGSPSSDSRSGGTKRKSRGGDGEGHLVYDAGLLLNERYEVVSTLGEGAFGKVVECLDRNKSERVALKIVKNTERYREAAQSEIAVLKEINSLDDDHTFACVRMLDSFHHHGHICIVFELLGPSTFDYLRENDFLPFTVEHIRHMAFQIFRAVCFLHRNKVTHTDLKPENILFVHSAYHMDHGRQKQDQRTPRSLDQDQRTPRSLDQDQRTPRSLDVKVVDFGNATFDRDHHPSLVSTRHYRAPEVILELGWNQACDVWSLGCILMEFYLGLTLFQTHDSKEHLAMMERVLGPLPPTLLSKTRKRHYVDRERLDWDENSNSGRYVRKHCKPLKQYMQSRSSEHQQLFELMGSMLEYDVSRRITMEEALWHPFFTPLRTLRCT